MSAVARRDPRGRSLVNPFARCHAIAIVFMFNLRRAAGDCQARLQNIICKHLIFQRKPDHMAPEHLFYW
jgi:hypothetical protein